MLLFVLRPNLYFECYIREQGVGKKKVSDLRLTTYELRLTNRFLAVVVGLLVGREKRDRLVLHLVKFAFGLEC